MGRGLIIILIASLALNVFAVGFFSGRVISNDGPPQHLGPGQGARLGHPLALMNYARELPPEIRDDFRRKIREKLPALREEHRNTQMLRRELASLIAADEWDRDAVAAKFAEIKVVEDLKRDVFTAAFVEALETLPAEERRKLIEATGKRGMKRHRLRDRRMPPPED